ncbi:peroxiredoxin family protein [Pseudorhodoplanes sinuspersici]|uniref:Uncharacterized protein n=1 Tax=Pseudorhodoplanes sinuspersici TaxID=1235591 RepID=A0A1W6ZLR0_9HYPH|nr:TlpA disulfide reductase family protein [Pseudorhodoplanes sinuspersici]ARP98301.1 hypothetical protein CAK95_03755 [Pseudorhodoplanes sinuspersici]RKE65954.1 peroxiredoxin [Pseudorhodoplanes sinuspersici]
MTISRRTALSALVTTLLPPQALSEALSLTELPGSVAAPDFTLTDLNGIIHRLSDYRGRPLLVNFWAVWCPPCRRELAALADLREQLSDTYVAVLAINLGDKAERIAAFLQQHPAPNLPVLLDHKKSTAAAWHVRGLPVAYAIDTAGILRYGALGERDWRAPIIERQLRSLP